MMETYSNTNYNVKKQITESIVSILPMLTFVDIPEMFNCIECKGVLRWPQQLDCGHRYEIKLFCIFYQNLS